MQNAANVGVDDDDDADGYCSFIDFHPLTIVVIYGIGSVSFIAGLAVCKARAHKKWRKTHFQITLYLNAYNVRRQKSVNDDLSTRFTFKGATIRAKKAFAHL